MFSLEVSAVFQNCYFEKFILRIFENYQKIVLSDSTADVFLGIFQIIQKSYFPEHL